ncbi:MAG: VWA domain-containing protein, partial [Planctomycetes bacterium]|nr:VWA domain-containing protein [Planctomycetota bacterium]
MPFCSFHHPQVLVLLLLLPLLRRYCIGPGAGLSGWLRLAMAALAVLALSRPRLDFTGPETDVIVVVDRSLSCAPAAETMFRELMPLAGRERRRGDRLAVIGFGDGAVLESGFGGTVAGRQQPEDFAAASDLAAALRLAGSLRSPGRRTAVLCLTDGEVTGEDPLGAEVVTALAGLPVWYRLVGDRNGLDVAAGEILLPEAVQPRSAWLVRFSIHATAPTETDYVLSRDGREVARGRAELGRGVNHFFARDSAEEGPLLRYRLETTTPGDAVRWNDTAEAVLRVTEAPRALVVNHGTTAGVLVRSLEAASIPVDRLDPLRFPESPAALAPYRLVVLENCRVSDFPGRGAAALAGAVEAGVVSLLVTGGANSFGMGGYHRSPLDPLLPVGMEMRDDIHRGTVAVAIALDRSGSMVVDAGGGHSKMDLANLGAAESIRLLTPRDQVSVIAVDTQPHMVVPLSYADDVEPLVSRTLGIQSMGGGIYCLSAIQAAAAEVRKSAYRNRHIIIFADAADAEEQEGCFALARELVAEGIRLSVVALGAEHDVDAAFLQELARHGDGEALFASHAAGLPALFTQEVTRISRRGFVEEEVTPRLSPLLELMGVTDLSRPPQLLGYNVAHLRAGATAFMEVEDEWRTPLLALRGGRAGTGALCFEVEGEFAGAFTRWSETPRLLVAVARRLAGDVQLAGVKAYS